MSARPHFRIIGIPVRIEPLFWLAAVFLAYGLGDARLIIMWVAVVLVSVLVHELGHAFALRAFGQSSSIVLHGFGGMTFSQRRLPRARSIAVSLAGPLTALVVLGIPAYMVRESDLGFELLRDYVNGGRTFGLWPVVFFAAYVNIWWSVANLLPIRPLDGGNVLTELVGIQPARIVSMVVGAAAAVWAYTHSDDFQFAAFFAGILALINFSEYRRARQGQVAPSAFDIEGPSVTGGGGARPGQSPAGGAHRPGPPRSGGRPTRPPSRRSGPPVPSEVVDLPGGVDPASAESFAWNMLRSGDAAGARRVLARSTGPVSPFVSATAEVASGNGVDALVQAYLDRPSGPPNLVPATVVDQVGGTEELTNRLLQAGPSGLEAAKGLQTHLQYGERFHNAAAVGERVYAADTTTRAQVAFDVACSWSRAGDVERAVEWVHRAIDDGFSAPSLLQGEPDLEAARATPAWDWVRRRLEQL